MDRNQIKCIQYQESQKPSDDSISDPEKQSTIKEIKEKNIELIDEYSRYRGSINFAQLIHDLDTDLTFNSSLHQNIGSYLASDKESYRHILPHLTVVSEGTASGVVAFGTPDYDGYPFSVKVENNPGDGDIINEAYIAISALNNLKKYIPNFYYVYDLFSCDNISTFYKRVLSFCDYNGEYGILAGERVPNSVPLKQYLKRITRHGFNIIFLQLMNALNMAYEKTGFVHGDLHLDNILIRTFAKPVNVPIYNPDLTFCGYISTTDVLYMIDYGYSHIGTQKINTKLPNDHFWSEFSIYPAFDSHRILMAAGIELTRKDPFRNAVYDMYDFEVVNAERDANVAKSLGIKSEYYQLIEKMKKINRETLLNKIKLYQINVVLREYELRGLGKSAPISNFPDYEAGQSEQYQHLLEILSSKEKLEQENQVLSKELSEIKAKIRAIPPATENQKLRIKKQVDEQILKEDRNVFYDKTILKDFKELFHSIFSEKEEDIMYTRLKASNEAKYDTRMWTDEQKIEYNNFYGIISRDLLFKNGKPRDHKEGLAYMIKKCKNMIIPFDLPSQEKYDSCSFLNRYWLGGTGQFQYLERDTPERSDSFYLELTAVSHYLKKWNDYILSNPIKKENSKSSTVFILLTKAISIAHDFINKVNQFGSEQEKKELTVIDQYWKIISKYVSDYKNMTSGSDTSQAIIFNKYFGVKSKLHKS